MSNQLGEKLRELLYKYDMEMDMVNLNIERELAEVGFKAHLQLAYVFSRN